MNENVIEISRGEKRAVFRRASGGWTPDWFYEGSRPMLRFKDHEWLSIGHVRPRVADSAEALPGGGAVFRGTSLYGRTRVGWSVTVAPDPDGEGFSVECELAPAESIELLEAFSAFETPYEYDGSETATTVIGMNPVSRWRGAERLTPPIWENPAWVYSRPQSARNTAPSNAPYLFQAITEAGTVRDRFVAIVGDWAACALHDIYSTPTRDTPKSPPTLFANRAELRGYKYLVGALNWSSSFVKDPNVLFEAGKVHRQRIFVDYASKMPRGSLDAALLGAWERAALLDIPADGRVGAFERASARGASWRAATAWLRSVFCSGRPTEGLFRPGEGIATYAVGTRPKGGDDYSWYWWPQWAGPLRYRASLSGDEELSSACDRLDAAFADWASTLRGARAAHLAGAVSSLPTIRWLAATGSGGPLREVFGPLLVAALERSRAENGRRREMDFGAQAILAEAFLLGARVFGDAAMREQGMVLVDEIARRLEGNFWEFNVGPAGSLVHGGQIRSLGHGHAIMANLEAARATGDPRRLADARRFARYLLAVSYATHNGSLDPDFDTRGWCNGSNAGRDQIAECPPWETQNGLLCVCALMGETELEPGFHDAVWYIARTGLAQFPAARLLKRVLDPSGRARFVERATLGSERDFYDILPYLAYENPHDQTLLASYQGSDCLLGELAWGGALARSSDARLGLVVPAAAMMDPAVAEERRTLVWNPTRTPISATVAAIWPDGGETQSQIEAPPRRAVALVLRKG